MNKYEGDITKLDISTSAMIKNGLISNTCPSAYWWAQAPSQSSSKQQSMRNYRWKYNYRHIRTPNQTHSNHGCRHQQVPSDMQGLKIPNSFDKATCWKHRHPRGLYNGRADIRRISPPLHSTELMEEGRSLVCSMQSGQRVWLSSRIRAILTPLPHNRWHIINAVAL